MLQQLGLQLPKNLCPRFRAMQRLRYQRKLRLMLCRLQPRLWILCPCFHPSSKRRRLRNLGLEGPKMPPMLQKLGLQKRSLLYRIRPMQHFRFKWKLRLLLQRLQLSLRQMRPRTHWKSVTWLRKLGLGQPNLQAMLKQMGLKQSGQNSNKKCVPVNDNCQKWDNNGSCTSCYAGYVLNNGSCSQGNPLCLSSNSNGACTICYTGYILDNGNCVPISKLANHSLYYSLCCPERLAASSTLGGSSGSHVSLNAWFIQIYIMNL